MLDKEGADETLVLDKEGADETLVLDKEGVVAALLELEEEALVQSLTDRFCLNALEGACLLTQEIS